jgi:hypothetical protein
MRTSICRPRNAPPSTTRANRHFLLPARHRHEAGHCKCHRVDRFAFPRPAWKPGSPAPKKPRAGSTNRPAATTPDACPGLAWQESIEGQGEARPHYRFGPHLHQAVATEILFFSLALLRCELSADAPAWRSNFCPAFAGRRQHAFQTAPIQDTGQDSIGHVRQQP